MPSKNSECFVVFGVPWEGKQVQKRKIALLYRKHRDFRLAVLLFNATNPTVNFFGKHDDKSRDLCVCFVKVHEHTAQLQVEGFAGLSLSAGVEPLERAVKFFPSVEIFRCEREHSSGKHVHAVVRERERLVFYTPS